MLKQELYRTDHYRFSSTTWTSCKTRIDRRLLHRSYHTANSYRTTHNRSNLKTTPSTNVDLDLHILWCQLLVVQLHILQEAQRSSWTTNLHNTKCHQHLLREAWLCHYVGQQHSVVEQWSGRKDLIQECFWPQCRC